MNPQITVNSIIFYCVLSVIVLLLAILAQKTKKKEFAIAIAVVLTFVAGFRAYSVGRDTRNYIIIFDHVDQGGYFNKEIGFVLLCKILLTIINNYTFLFLVFSAIFFGLTIYRFWELRNRISFAVAVFAFYSFYFFESMNIVRQLCAVAIVFFATRYLQKKRYIPFMFAVVLSTVLFHKTALLGVLFLGAELFSWKDLEKGQRRLLVALMVSGVLFGGFILAFLGGFTEQYVHYFSNAEANIGLRVPALMFIFLVSLFFYQRRGSDTNRTIREQGEEYLLRNTRIYYVLGCALGSIGYFFDFMGRIGYYFAFFQFVYFGFLVKERYRQYRLILKVLVYFVILYTLYGYIFVNNGAWHHPYYFIWDR